MKITKPKFRCSISGRIIYFLFSVSIKNKKVSINYKSSLFIFRNAVNSNLGNVLVNNTRFTHEDDILLQSKILKLVNSFAIKIICVKRKWYQLNVKSVLKCGNCIFRFQPAIQLFDAKNYHNINLEQEIFPLYNIENL